MVKWVYPNSLHDDIQQDARAMCSNISLRISSEAALRINANTHIYTKVLVRSWRLLGGLRSPAQAEGSEGSFAHDRNQPQNVQTKLSFPDRSCLDAWPARQNA